MSRRVVVTGLGVVSSNGVGKNAFLHALQKGVSGIRYLPELEENKFICVVGGIPEISQLEKETFMDQYNLVKLRSSGILYGCMAGIEAWKDAGLDFVSEDSEVPDWDAGCIFGSVSNGLEPIEHGIRLIDKGDVKKMGGRAAQQAMNSGVSAYLGGIIGMGNQVSTNSASSNTGTESIIEAYHRIKYGYAERMLAGSSEGNSQYIWAGSDCMMIDDCIFDDNASGVYAVAPGFRDNPEKASAPMSTNAVGFVHGSGAGAVVLESLESALARNANIYAEIIGGQVNAGGTRSEARTHFMNGHEGMVRCIQEAIADSKLLSERIDLISGDLTSSLERDLHEIRAWSQALGVEPANFPRVNALKSMIGYCNGAAGSIESVACILQLYADFVHPTLNSEGIQPNIAALINPSKVSSMTEWNADLQVIAKGSFGYGDVNACLIFKKWNGEA